MFREICLSEDSCCGGPPGAKIFIQDNMVTLTDGRLKTKVLSKKSWNRTKEHILEKKQLPIHIKQEISLSLSELSELIYILEQEQK